MRLLAKYGVTPSAYFLIQDCRGNKVPNKYLHSPPEMQKAARIYASILQYEEWINEELRAIDAERAAAALDKVNLQRARNSIVYPASPGIEQTLF
jgi:hypothetical protein